MSEQAGLEAALRLVVEAYETGDVARDVIDTLHQLLPFSQYCSVAICASGEWLAASSNLFCPGSITMTLLPKDESLAGLATILSRQLRSYKQIADQRLFDVEHFHKVHGPGALIATPLPGREGPPVRNAAGGYTSTSLGALLVNLDLEPATPVDLRMRAHLRTVAAKLAPLIEAPGRATMERLFAACFPPATLGGCLGAEVPPPKQSATARRRRGGTCEDPSRWPDDHDDNAASSLPVQTQNPFSDGASAAFDAPQEHGSHGATGDLPPLPSSNILRRIMDLSPISSSLLPGLPTARKSDAATLAQSASSSGAAGSAGARPSQQDAALVRVEEQGPGGSESESISSEDTARARNGLLGRASPGLSSIEWPTGEEATACRPEHCHLGAGAEASSSRSAATTSLQTCIADDDDDVAAEKLAARQEVLAPASQQHPLWLTFRGADLEHSFAAWHSIQLQKMDRLAISMAVFIFAFLGFVPPHSLAMHTPVAYAATAAIMLFLLGFAWIAHPCRYLARRTLILKAFVLLYTTFNSQVGFPGVLSAMPGGNGSCSIPFVLRYINAQPLLTSCLVTMARLRIQAPIQALQLVLALALPSKVCKVCYGGRSPAVCLANLHTQQVIVGVLAPLAIVYLAERRFRATFLNNQLKKKG
ncbi:g9985 [Coccomyxa elongata]